MKKISVMLLIVFFIGIMSANGTYAGDGKQYTAGGNDAKYALIGEFSCKLTISGTTAYPSAKLEANSSVDDCEIELMIQEKVGFLWITRASWTLSSHSNHLSISRQYTVSSGKTYRAKAKATVYSANDSESATVVSAAIEN